MSLDSQTQIDKREEFLDGKERVLSCTPKKHKQERQDRTDYYEK